MQSQQTLQNLINRTYHLNMTYDNPNSTLVAGFGRLYLPWAPSLDTIDGGYFGKRISNGATLGIFGGSTPDPSSWDYSPNRVIGGAFINFEGGEFDGFHYSSTAGAGVSMVNWAIDRPFIFFEDSVSYKRDIAIYESAQLDSPAGNSSTPAPGPGLGRNFFTLRVNPHPRVELDFNYNYFRDVPTFDPTLVGTGLLDKFLFQGFSAGGRVEVLKQVWLSTNLGRSSRTGDSKASLNQMYRHHLRPAALDPETARRCSLCALQQFVRYWILQVVLALAANERTPAPGASRRPAEFRFHLDHQQSRPLPHRHGGDHAGAALLPARKFHHQPRRHELRPGHVLDRLSLRHEEEGRMMHSTQTATRRTPAACSTILVVTVTLLAGIVFCRQPHGISGCSRELNDLLARTADQTAAFLEQFSDVKCTEQVRQEKLGKDDKVELKEDSTYDYLVILTNAGGELNLSESRIPVHEAKRDRKNTSMLLSNGFATLFLVFHPYYAQAFTFTLAGEEIIGGRDSRRKSLSSTSRA